MSSEENKDEQVISVPELDKKIQTCLSQKATDLKDLVDATLKQSKASGAVKLSDQTIQTISKFILDLDIDLLKDYKTKANFQSFMSFIIRTKSNFSKMVSSDFMKKITEICTCYRDVPLYVKVLKVLTTDHGYLISYDDYMNFLTKFKDFINGSIHNTYGSSLQLSKNQTYILDTLDLFSDQIKNDYRPMIDLLLHLSLTFNNYNLSSDHNMVMVDQIMKRYDLDKLYQPTQKDLSVAYKNGQLIAIKVLEKDYKLSPTFDDLKNIISLKKPKGYYNNFDSWRLNRIRQFFKNEDYIKKNSNQDSDGDDDSPEKFQLTQQDLETIFVFFREIDDLLDILLEKNLLNTDTHHQTLSKYYNKIKKTKTVESLCEIGFRPSQTALKAMCSAKNIRLLRKMVERFEDLKINQDCLVEALQVKNNLATVRFLIENGVKPNIDCIEAYLSANGNSTLSLIMSSFLEECRSNVLSVQPVYTSDEESEESLDSQDSAENEAYDEDKSEEHNNNDQNNLTKADAAAEQNLETGTPKMQMNKISIKTPIKPMKKIEMKKIEAI